MGRNRGKLGGVGVIGCKRSQAGVGCVAVLQVDRQRGGIARWAEEWVGRLYVQYVWGDRNARGYDSMSIRELRELWVRSNVLYGGRARWFGSLPSAP